ncbi:MAG: LacI family DNA-binding transcriptional regulator [Ancrocorticia sp.]|uniref:LacI family DNA-binding transcriptional regulator n=1 Tax=Ancrocorticia sp. TaxID=2593684 RepID=UPI003F901ED3
MAEVAKIAGVSHQTVSRVVNGFPGVRPQTRDRIEKAIIETGYRRNSAARALVTSRSGIIGVITVGSFLYGPTSTLAAIDEAARKNHYTILLSSVREGEESDLRGAVNSCLDQGAEALIVIAARKPLVEQIASMKIDVPLIAVGPSPANAPELSCLSVDQFQGARLAIKHLIEIGHSEILVLSGPDNWFDASQRLAGALDTCQSAGITPRIAEGDWSAECGYQLGMDLAQDPQSLPTAIFAANDHMALGLIAAFHANEIDLPSRVSIVGFDDVPESAFYTPSLTTVHQDFTTLGQRVLAATLAFLEQEEPDLTPVQPTLQVRTSCTVPSR